MNMKNITNITVIKFGGEIVESKEQLNNLALSIKKLHQQGENIVLIHGGGPQATKLSTRLGLTAKMVGGRRVTCAETLDVMKMTLPGIINSNILSIFKAHGLPAVSASGINIVNAKKRPPKAVSGSNGEVVDFGFVGDIVSIDTTIIDHLLSGKFIPVISPLSADQEGQILNINADTVAVQITKKLKAEKFVLVTEVGGVYQNLDDKNSKFTTLTMADAKKKIADGIIQGGMIPKLEESFTLLEDQLHSFHIVGLQQSDSILQEIKRPGSMGTAVVR
ncbi:MAG: acetylglutamate kinase [Oligoflexia bacterium]|nr:acetylglutamate kinase [Oligoflexia bacterium]